MAREMVRYSFSQAVAPRDIEETLLLAVLAAECLHGVSRVRLDASYWLDGPSRRCVLDASRAVGRTLNRLFTGLAAKEFGEDAFTVERVNSGPKRRVAEAG